MAAGLQVFNDAGVLQIDQDYRNYQLRSKGTGTCSTSWNTGGVQKWRTTVTVTSATAPIVFIRPNSTAFICQWGASVSGSTWAFEFYSTTQNAAFDWYAFDVTVSGTLPNFGLEVFNASGQRVFHSSIPPLKVVNVRAAGSGNLTIPSGRTYAALQTTSGFFYTDTLVPPGPDTYRYFSRCRAVAIASGQFLSDPIMVFEDFTRPTGTPQPGWTPQTPQFVTADVTFY